MSRFNKPGTRSAVSSPVRSSSRAPDAVNAKGAPGHTRDPKSELYLLAVCNMVGQSTFYESAGGRDSRFTELVRRLAVSEPEWLLGMLGWLRQGANLRTAALVGAAEAVKARTDAGKSGWSRQMVRAVLQRPDEPGELLAYWQSTHGRKLPMPLKRGVADAVGRLYRQRAVIKYDTASHGFRFADVVQRVHPTPGGPEQAALLGYITQRRRDSSTPVPEELDTIRARQALESMPLESRREMMRRSYAADTLRRAGMTWEGLASWLQRSLTASDWEAIIPSMGYMALLRNLRNFDQAGVSDETADRVAAKLIDPYEVTRSRQMPIRFLSAYRAVSGGLRWHSALDRAFRLSMSNVPQLRGRTLVLVDQSGSMFHANDSRSGMQWAEVAALFGSVVALRAESADLVRYGTNSAPVQFSQGESPLAVSQRFGSMGGTNTVGAMRAHFQRHDRVVLLTDEQYGSRSNYGSYAQPSAGQVIRDLGVPVYTFNIGGYQVGHSASGEGSLYTFGGLNDQGFRLMDLIERGRDADWPWLLDQ